MNCGMHAQLLVQRADFRLEVDLQLPGQGITALFGPSGCGKTTCLRSIAGLERAAGHVSLNGQIWQDDASGQWLPTHQRALGYVFQEASLFPHLSVQENLEYGLRRTPIERRRVGLEQAVELLGLERLLGRAVTRLSGGERQRVAIARALASSPQLLLMDEPLSALDAARKAEVLPYLERLQHSLQLPILYVSHAADEVARLAQQVVVLHAGRVLLQADTASAMASLDLPLGQAGDSAELIEGRVESHDPLDHVSTIAFAGGQLLLTGASHRAIGDSVRIRVLARDVSLALAPASQTSLLNSLPARITDLREDAPGQVLVGLSLGPTALLARVTARSVRQLDLRIGQSVYAQVKGMALLG